MKRALAAVCLVLNCAPLFAADSPPLALALNLTFGANFWREVQVSSSGPVADIADLVRQGYYKLEIIELLLMSQQARVPLAKAVEKRKKGAALAEMAAGYQLVYDQIYEAAVAVEEIVDAEYLPLFPERRQRRWRKE